MVSVATPFLYFKFIISDDEIAFPFLAQVICGSGSPFTVHCNASVSPSTTSKSFNGSVNSGLHINESSGGTAHAERKSKIENQICVRGKYVSYVIDCGKCYLRINSFVALRDLDGLPGASNFPYFFFEEGVGDVALAKSVSVLLESMLFNFDEMLDATCELEVLFTVCERNVGQK